jgi:electron transfer flavoprotein alpha subunit
VKEIWVFAEHSDGAVDRVSLELLGEARDLARGLDARVAALAVGDEVESLSETLARYGAGTVYLIQHAGLRHYDPEIFVESIGRLCAERQPQLVLFPATSTGSDVAVRLAVTRRWPFAPGCVRLRVRDGEIEMTRPLAGGGVHAVVTQARPGPCLASVAPDVIGLEPPDASRRAEVVRAAAAASEQRQIDVHGFVRADPASVDLGEAELVVAAGRGIGSQHNMRLVEELAGALGASIGGTRALVDLGWLPHSAQIGQTGASVRPRLYLACGISGATQHTVGMKDSDTILAINTDPAAPIFRIADLGLVADAAQLIPALTARCRREGAEP